MSRGYDDIIRLPCPVSSKRPRMAVQDRAAQFAPFAALTGYDAAIREMARTTTQRIELDEGEKDILNEKLRKVSALINCQPIVSVTYFRPDGRKSGGAYITVTGKVKRIDACRHTLSFVDGTRILFEQILDIQAEELF